MRSILYLKKEVRFLEDTLNGYLEVAGILQTCLDKGEDTILESELEEYLYASRVQRYAHRIMCGANLLLIEGSGRYEIEEVLHILNSLLPPLIDSFYGPYLTPEEQAFNQEVAQSRKSL